VAAFGQPFASFFRRKRDELNACQAASWASGGRVKRTECLVRRYEDEHAKPLADQPIDHVQEPRQALAGALLRIGSEQLARVLEDKKAPALVLVVVAVRQNVENVSGSVM